MHRRFSSRERCRAPELETTEAHNARLLRAAQRDAVNVRLKRLIPATEQPARPLRRRSAEVTGPQASKPWRWPSVPPGPIGPENLSLEDGPASHVKSSRVVCIVPIVRGKDGRHWQGSISPGNLIPDDGHLLLGVLPKPYLRLVAGSQHVHSCAARAYGRLQPWLDRRPRVWAKGPPVFLVRMPTRLY